MALIFYRLCATIRARHENQKKFNGNFCEGRVVVIILRETSSNFVPSLEVLVFVAVRFWLCFIVLTVGSLDSPTVTTIV